MIFKENSVFSLGGYYPAIRDFFGLSANKEKRTGNAKMMMININYQKQHEEQKNSQKIYIEKFSR